MESHRAPLEIERKYLIRMPDEAVLRRQAGYSVCKIRQDYLLTPEGWSSERVRRSAYSDGSIRFTHTRKRRLSAATAVEDEETLDEAGYLALLSRADPRLHSVWKVRHTFFSDGQCYEIDIYPFWHRSCVLETELDSESKSAKIPAFLDVLCEVTGEKQYSNHAIARKTPPEYDF